MNHDALSAAKGFMVLAQGPQTMLYAIPANLRFVQQVYDGVIGAI